MLKYAELLLEKGEIDRCINVLHQCERYVGRLQSTGAATAYLYYLRASALFSNLLQLLAQNSSVSNESRDDQQQTLVRELYASCRSAESIYPPLKKNHLESLVSIKRLVEIKTGISEDSF